MNNKRTPDLRIEGARLIFRNFAGKETKYTGPGHRTTAVIIDDLELAERLRQDGWNVKDFRPNPDTGEVDAAFLSVKINYDNRPPKIVLITGTRDRNKQTVLDEESVSMLDWMDILSVDVVISPYHYSVSGREGISAYLKTMYVLAEEDAFASKWESEDEDEVPFE